MKVLVTGGAGFIGSWITQCLCDNGHEVAVLDDLSGGRRENVDPRAKFVQGSICDPSKVESVMGAKFDAVIHAAAYAAERYSHFVRRHVYWRNVMGSLCVINGAVNSGVKRFVFLSSIAVYGDFRMGPHSEAHWPHPIDPYGVTKLAIEMDLMAAHRQFGMEYTIFRPHNVIGPRQSINDRARNVAGIFIRQALSNHPLTVIGEGKQVRNFSPVIPVARCIASSIDIDRTANRAFNIGSDKPRTVRDLAGMIEALVPGCSIAHLPEQNEAFEARASHTLAQHTFPAADYEGMDDDAYLMEMLRGMIAEAKQNGLGELRPLPSPEITKDLPEDWK